MLHNFTLKRRFMAPTTTSQISSQIQQYRSNSSPGSQNPSVVSQETFYYAAPKHYDGRDQLKPILRNTSVTVKTQDPGKLLLDRFADLYTSLDSADVSIMCGRNHDTLKAHQRVLSFGSEYFRDALAVAQCKHPVIVVKNVPGDVMSQVLEYLYLGHVTLKSESELKEFLSSAKYLFVFGIRDEQYSVTK